MTFGTTVIITISIWCKYVLFYFFNRLNYKSIELRFESWILLSSSANNGEDDRKPFFINSMSASMFCKVFSKVNIVDLWV
jgi:hypothetical protein